MAAAAVKTATIKPGQQLALGSGRCRQWILPQQQEQQEQQTEAVSKARRQQSNHQTKPAARP
jgi:hypothetical protein